MKAILKLSLIFLVALGSFSATNFAAAADPVYDIVIKNGRVMDPEKNFDQTGMNIGITGKTIQVITKDEIKGKTVIDATGQVVSPGFVDLMSYDPNKYGVWFKIADGVTTNLAMHGGTVEPVSWYKTYQGQKPPVNFGAGFFYNSARNSMGVGMYRAATADEIKRLTVIARKALDNGALGIGMSPEYVPGTSTAEIKNMMMLAKEYNVPIFFHVRYSDMEKPGTNIEALQEVIDLARVTGARMHIDHINSTGGTFSMIQSLKMLEDARKEGMIISADIYPYNFWGTYLNSARFNSGWQQRFRISYDSLQIAGTTEFLNSESFAKYRKMGKLAVAYAIPEDDVVNAIKDPYVMIGSDAIMEPANNNHPRGAGAFSRTIALYVREKKTITLMEALRKMTIMPVNVLEKQSPALQKKGRLQVGMDADIVVFDYNKIQDMATVQNPAQFSRGISYVLVNGQIVRDPNGLKRDVRPGAVIRTSR